MSFLVPRPVVALGDSVLWNAPAKYSVSGHSMGGALYITSSELIYAKGRFGGTMRGDIPPRFPLNEITEVDVMERTYTPYDGGMRRRLRVRRLGGAEYLFVVKHPDDVARRLAELVELARPAHAPSGRDADIGSGSRRCDGGSAGGGAAPNRRIDTRNSVPPPAARPPRDPPSQPRSGA